MRYFFQNVIDYSMDLETAIGFPRFLWDGGETVSAEEGFLGLEHLGMKKQRSEYPTRTGVAQGAEIIGQTRKGVCDIRGDALPMGD